VIPSTAREDALWERTDWVGRTDNFDVTVRRQPRTLKQYLRLVETPKNESEVVTVVHLTDIWIAHEQQAFDQAVKSGWLGRCLSELKRWDIYDFATVLGVVLACVGFIFALFPPLRSWGVLFPIGAALMALAAYGARHTGAYTD
jgi:hypothetical protein